MEERTTTAQGVALTGKTARAFGIIAEIQRLETELRGIIEDGACLTIEETEKQEDVFKKYFYTMWENAAKLAQETFITNDFKQL